MAKFQTKFLTIGEPMVVFASQQTDVPLSKVQSMSLHSAGAELNVAIGIARLEHNASYISALGNDFFGDFLLQKIADANVNTSFIGRDDVHNTGIYFKESVSKGDPQVHYLRKNSAVANMPSRALDAVDLNEYAVLHLSGIYPAISEIAADVMQDLIDRASKAGTLITYDPNLRPALWSSEEEMVRKLNVYAKYADLVMPGTSEGKILCGSSDPEDIANFYFQNSDKTQYVVVKLGAQGAYLAKRTAEGIAGVVVSGFEAPQVVDTVGAGDGFAVGLISAMLEDLPIEDAVERACAIGALAVSVCGDNDGYPTRSELERFMV